MRLAMVIMAVLCVGLGVFPGSLYAILPYPVGYVPYTADHVLKMLQLLLFSGLAFFLLLPMMKRSLTITLDVDWFYRHAGDKIARSLAKLVSAFIKSFDDMISLRLKMFSRLNLMLNGSESVLTRSQHTGSMVMWVIVVLCGYLAFYLFG